MSNFLCTCSDICQASVSEASNCSSSHLLPTALFSSELLPRPIPVLCNLANTDVSCHVALAPPLPYAYKLDYFSTHPYFINNTVATSLSAELIINSYQFIYLLLHRQLTTLLAQSRFSNFPFYTIATRLVPATSIRSGFSSYCSCD